MPPRDITATPTLDPIEDITRREILRGALALPILAAGVSCGDDDAEDGPKARTVDDAFGPVELPAGAERYVAADEITFGNLLALGVQPLGGTWYTDELAEHLRAKVEGDPVNLLSAREFDLERALALQPDLIVTAGATWVEEFCDQLKAGAPTYCYPYGYVTKEEIFANLRGAALAVGLEDRAEALIAEYDERIERLREKVVETGWDTKPVSMVDATDPSTFYLMVNGIAPFVLSDLGIPRREGEELTEDDIQLSTERLGDLDSAFAILVGASPEGLTVLESNPLWPQLEAVKTGRVLLLNDRVWGAYDFVSLFTILDIIEQQVLPLADN